MFIPQEILKKEMMDPELKAKFPEPTQRIEAVKAKLAGGRPAVSSNDFDRAMAREAPPSREPTPGRLKRKFVDFDYVRFQIQQIKEGTSGAAWSQSQGRFLTPDERLKILERRLQS